MAIVSERIKEGLALRKMTQAELSAKTGIGKSSISTYIKGGYEPKINYIHKIARHLMLAKGGFLDMRTLPKEQKRTFPSDLTISFQFHFAAFLFLAL